MSADKYIWIIVDVESKEAYKSRDSFEAEELSYSESFMVINTETMRIRHCGEEYELDSTWEEE